MSFYFPEAKSEREKERCLKRSGTGSLSRLVVPITATFEFAPVSEGSTE